jgi:hypothetical protein
MRGMTVCGGVYHIGMNEPKQLVVDVFFLSVVLERLVWVLVDMH